MANRNIDITFRQNPVHGIKGNLSTVFKDKYVNYNISEILNHLTDRISDTRYGMLQRNQFTLVNVYNPDTQHSVGYLKEPPKELVTSFSGLVFTFALTSRPLRKTPNQIFKTRIIDKTHFWGTKLENLTDYLTIAVPKDFLSAHKSYFPYVDDLLYLYNMCGMYTKNFVLNSLSIYDTSPVDVLYSRYFAANLKYLFNSCSKQYWRYCDQLWDSCPNILSDEDYDTNFYLYYCLYLFDRVNINSGKTAKAKLLGKGKGTLHDFLLDGLRAFVHSVKSNAEPVMEQSLTGTVSLLLHLIDGEGLSSGDSSFEVRDFIDRTRTLQKSDSTAMFEFSTLFSDLSKVAEDLVKLNPEAKYLSFWR
tara:strand:- start:503 stop:1585 length:1083 start_codon:yes stop_codon:yes gene_type:complete